MPARIRYLSSSAISRKDLTKLADAIICKEYTDKVPWGFIDVRNEGDCIWGVFVERFESEDEVTDPFGSVVVYKRTQFSQIKFRLGLTVPQLELHDAPRSFSPLLTELSGCLSPNLSFESVQINLRKLIPEFKKKSTSVVLIATTLKGTSLAPDVVASVSVNGNLEITPYLRQVSFGKNYSLEKICITGTNSTGSFKVEIFADGRFQVLSGYSEGLIDILRKIIEGLLA